MEVPGDERRVMGSRVMASSAELCRPTADARGSLFASAEVAPGVLLDSRLALFHTVERWLAVADLHYGYEVSLRAAGALLPTYGMDDIERRLHGLLADYRPARLLLLGDLVHGGAARAEADAFLARLRRRGAATTTEGGSGCEIHPLLGNHDRRAFAGAGLAEHFVTHGFFFHHGDRPVPAALANGRIVVEGHHHPAATLRDGAGLALKLPAFVQGGDGGRRWTLPAFSPWAAGGSGGRCGRGAPVRRWLCAPRRIFPLARPG